MVNIYIIWLSLVILHIVYFTLLVYIISLFFRSHLRAYITKHANSKDFVVQMQNVLYALHKDWSAQHNESSCKNI